MTKDTLPNLVVSEEEANEKIQSQIEKGQRFHDLPIRSEGELEKAKADSRNWYQFNRTLLLKLFDNSSIAERYESNYTASTWVVPSLDTLSAEIDWYRKKIVSQINSLEGICEELQLFNGPSDTASPTLGKEIFIVHGREDEIKETVARFVEQLGLKATILHEQPNEGRTIIEKLEDCADRAGFAIVLLTPDDVGALKDRIEGESKPRARQNVIFELGYFMGKLGRERVCPLFKGEIENPSDIDGVVYVPMNDTDGWKLKLCQEMKNAGFLIDLNKLA